MSPDQTVGASLLAMDVNDDAISLGKLTACKSIVGNLFHIRIRMRAAAEATARSKDRSLVALDSSYKRATPEESETNSSRNRSNGYVHQQDTPRRSHRDREQARSYSLSRGHQGKMHRLSGRHREQAQLPQGHAQAPSVRSAVRPPRFVFDLLLILICLPLGKAERRFCAVGNPARMPG